MAKDKEIETEQDSGDITAGKLFEQFHIIYGNPPQKQSTKGVEFFRSKEGDSINDNIKTQ